ncbi:Methyltransferase domain-containing protein [Alkalispirochaeta americana]|uniref:Methyltransferase domain-containing protein n=1 Tax=Alkalispirochaeta americana TaxID=159291 RepID=A0A1N6PX63_9SPIO|nr:class I SAM-dependent methyltransferase [Alkalispirochaeta americana]SIQ08799.1 Methyltransferase domain-containing protein [Alkalispirochaeta americana]
MHLYQAIAVEYSSLFPSSPEKIRCIESRLTATRAQTILDIGCASGEFTRRLESPHRTITGLDLDDAMISEARLQAGASQNVTFVQGEMKTYLKQSGPATWDALLCLGNTIAYLTDADELLEFLTQALRVLRPGGYLAIQILNYSNPEIRPGFIFPLVESARLRFSRRYISPGEIPSDENSPYPGFPARPPSSTPGGGYGFETRVIDKKTGESLQDCHRHSPFPSTTLATIARKAGFCKTEIHGDYQGRSAGTEDFFHMLHLWKKL